MAIWRQGKEEVKEEEKEKKEEEEWGEGLRCTNNTG